MSLAKTRYFFILALLSVLWLTVSAPAQSGAWDIVSDGTFLTLPNCPLGPTQAGGTASMSGQTATFTTSSGNWGASFTVGSSFVASGWTPAGYNTPNILGSTPNANDAWVIASGGAGSSSLTATAMGVTGLANSTVAGNLQISCQPPLQYNVYVTWNAADGQNAILKLHSSLPYNRVINVAGLSSNMSNGGLYILKVVQDSTGGVLWQLGSGCNWQYAIGAPRTLLVNPSGLNGGGANNLTANMVEFLMFTYDGMGNCLVLSQ